MNTKKPYPVEGEEWRSGKRREWQRGLGKVKDIRAPAALGIKERNHEKSKFIGERVAGAVRTSL